MEGKKNLAARRMPNEAGKTLQRVRLFKHSHEQNSVKINMTKHRQVKCLKQEPSPFPGTSHNQRKGKSSKILLNYRSLNAKWHTGVRHCSHCSHAEVV